MVLFLVHANVNVFAREKIHFCWFLPKIEKCRHLCCWCFRASLTRYTMHIMRKFPGPRRTNKLIAGQIEMKFNGLFTFCVTVYSILNWEHKNPSHICTCTQLIDCLMFIIHIASRWKQKRNEWNWKKKFHLSKYVRSSPFTFLFNRRLR